MVDRFRTHWSLIVPLVIYWVWLFVLVTQTMDDTNHIFTYSFDDPYIHLSMARNFVQHGTWGVSTDAFSSSSSSPLWTVMLSAVMVVVGDQELLPLVFNVVSGTLLLALIYSIMVRYGYHPLYRMGSLLLCLTLTPIIYTTLVGMEHLLHALLMLAFLYAVVEVIDSSDQDIRLTRMLLILAPLTTTVRYEGLFVVFTGCVVMLLMGRLKLAVGTGIMALLPLIIYGIINLHNGWFFLPGTVVVKTTYVSLSDVRSLQDLVDVLSLFAKRGQQGVMGHISMLIFVLISQVLFLSAFVVERPRWKQQPLLALMVGIVIILQFAVARAFIRYLVYLYIGLAAALLIVAYPYLLLLVDKARTSRRNYPIYLGIGLLALQIAYPLWEITKDSYPKTAVGMRHIYYQQYQMGTFLKEYYPDEVVAINDLGLTTYLGEIRPFDIAGLGTLEIAKAFDDHKDFTVDDLTVATDKLDPQIAVLYRGWLPRVPADWISVGQWTVTGETVYGTTVTFYAINHDRALELIQNLREYSPRLPKIIRQEGLYLLSNLGLNFYQLHAPVNILAPTIGIDGQVIVQSEQLYINSFFQDWLLKDIAPENILHVVPETNDLVNLVHHIEGLSPEEVEAFVDGHDEVWYVAPSDTDLTPIGDLMIGLGYWGTPYILQGEGYSYGEFHVFRFQKMPETMTTSFSFGEEAIQLLNYSILGEVAACETVRVQTWWTTDQVPFNNYSLTVEVQSQNGDRIIHKDEPINRLPMLLWQPDSYYFDERALDLPCDLPTGEYHISLGFYAVKDGAFDFLPAVDSQGDVVGDMPVIYPVAGE